MSSLLYVGVRLQAHRRFDECGNRLLFELPRCEGAGVDTSQKKDGERRTRSMREYIGENGRRRSFWITSSRQTILAR